MSFNGSGLFQINTAGQPVVSGTIIDSTVFNALTADLATGLSTCLTKDGQTAATANIPLGGNKITNLGIATADTDAASLASAIAKGICEFRLTLTSVTPVTTSDVTAATTVYMAPYKGNRIALYDGTNWHVRSTAQISIAVPATTSTMYDVFCYDNSGTPTLEALAWTNDTTRATALVLQDGVLVKSGATTRRYIGSFRTTTVSGQTEDSKAKRYVWNYYNRVRREMLVKEATASWNYTTATYRQANGSTANQLDFVLGWLEEPITARVISAFTNGTNVVTVSVGIGQDSTTSPASDGLGAGVNIHNSAIAQNTQISCHYEAYVAVGRHYLAWLEYSTAVGTTTWYGNSTCGIQGEIWG